MGGEALIAFGFTTLHEFVHSTVAGGYLVALAVICLLQYLTHLHRVTRDRRQSELFHQEINGLETALNHVQRDRALTRYENQILREFVSQTECEKAVGLLLRRFVPNPDEGFAAFLQMQDDEILVAQSRGFSPGSCERVQIEPALRQALQENRYVVLDGPALLRNLIWSRLAPADRSKVRQLFLLAVGEPDELLGVVMTTELFPAGAERKQQLELAERLMLSVGCSLKHKLALETQQTQLRWTSEMLQLRAIADRRFESPLKMIEEFLRQLTERVGGDESALFLASPHDEVTPLKTLARSGELQQAGIREQSQKYKETLARAGIAVQELLRFDAEGLERVGVTSLIGSALVVPLLQPQGLIGVICFTRRRRDGFRKEQEQLACWAADFLRDTILKAISQAAVERRARFDGLTQLANRQTFDQQMAQEMEVARTSGTACSLLLLDLDRFKSVNDTYGHRAGDQVLRWTAAVLRDRVGKIRAGDRSLVARYGGEEMAVILPGVNSEGAARIAETIRAGIESQEIDFDGQTLKVTTSVGLATYPQHAETIEELIAAADAAMYQAKAGGRNRVSMPDNGLVPA